MMASKSNILLVEDEDGVRKLVRKLLERQGYEVYEARNGEEALEMLDQIPRIDLLLTDMIMPRMGGRALAEKMEQLKPELKILFISGYTENTLLQEELIEKKHAFLQKPFSADALIKRVRHLLD